jgi:hypothetical protein
MEEVEAEDNPQPGVLVLVQEELVVLVVMGFQI